MSLYNTFDKARHFSELADNATDQHGNLKTPTERRDAAFQNLTGNASLTAAEVAALQGLTATSTELNLMDGVTLTTAELNGVKTAQEFIQSTHAKVGGTAGWVVNAADNLGLLATVPASQTASTLVVPITGLHVGDTITGFKVVAQIESAGGTVTLDADLRKLTTVAAAITDASVGAIVQISVTADTAVATEKTALAEVVAADETYYVLLTATTAASTDIALQGVTYTVTTS